MLQAVILSFFALSLREPVFANHCHTAVSCQSVLCETGGQTLTVTGSAVAHSAEATPFHFLLTAISHSIVVLAINAQIVFCFC